MSTDLAYTPLSLERSVEHLERETLRFVEVAARSPLAALVPAYPAFTVETLSAHTGGRGGSWERSLGGLTPIRGSHQPPPRGGPGSSPGSKTVSRRWDLETVLGDHAPVPSALAIGEIDKVFVPRLAGADVAPIGGTVQLPATDVPITRTASVRDGRLDAGRRTDHSTEADVVVAGSTEHLALVVWKGAPPPCWGVDVAGSVDVLKRFLSVDYIPDPRTTPVH